MLTEGSTPEEDAIVEAHFNRLQQLVHEGTVVLAGRTLVPDSMGLVILLAPDEAAARTIMENDPAVVGGVMYAELYPYRVALLKGHSTLP
jgi:uncharacterized protein YciI